MSLEKRYSARKMFNLDGRFKDKMPTTICSIYYIIPYITLTLAKLYPSTLGIFYDFFHLQFVVLPFFFFFFFSRSN